MRTALAPLVLLCALVALVECENDDTGYSFDNYHTDEINVADSNSSCPSDRLLRIRDICNYDGIDKPCIRITCCDGFIYIAGKCIHNSIDPCSLQLCEQACQVRQSKLWCTCRTGFNFSSHNYRMGIKPYCLDVDECAHNNGGCDQHCVNEPGGYHCECSPPFVLHGNGRCMSPIAIEVQAPQRLIRPEPMTQPMSIMRASSRCTATCDSVAILTKRVNQLHDSLRRLEFALKKVKDDQPMNGDQHFPDGTNPYRVLDSIAPLQGGYCRCERGPRGPPGAPGVEGPKGEMGPRGPKGYCGSKDTLDFMQLLINELRFDVRNIEKRVYKEGEKPERYNSQLEWRRLRRRRRLDKKRNNEDIMYAYRGPSVEAILDPDGTLMQGLTKDTAIAEMDNYDASTDSEEYPDDADY